MYLTTAPICSNTSHQRSCGIEPLLHRALWWHLSQWDSSLHRLSAYGLSSLWWLCSRPHYHFLCCSLSHDWNKFAPSCFYPKRYTSSLSHVRFYSSSLRWWWLPPRSDGSCPPHGHGRNFFLTCPYCGNQNHPANKCWKQFSKPPTAQAILTPMAYYSPTLPCIPTPQYHVILTSAEYDTLPCSMGIDVSSSTSLVSLLAPSISSTSALLASSSPSWIINSRAFSDMTGTSSLLSSYHPTTSHPPITIVDGGPSPIQGRRTTCVTPSLSLHQILYVPSFLVNLLSISAIIHALPCMVTFFPFRCIFHDFYSERMINLCRENGKDIYELVDDGPS